MNLETTLTRRGRYTGYPLFRSPVALADALRDAGVDVAVLANNHCCDGGAEGIRTTMAELDRCGILHTGVFADSADYKKNNPLYLNRCGMRLAIVNYTYGTNGMPVPAGTIVNLIDTVRMAADLAEARASGSISSSPASIGAMSTSVGRTPDNGVWLHFCVATASAW
ncbi:MAG: CapA family protein [Alistipes senegalensis]